MNLFPSESHGSAMRYGLTAACGLLANVAASGPARGQCNLAELAKVIASDAAAGDFFGGSVAVFGDTALIGAQVDDHAGGDNAGSAYVFVRTNGVWTQQAKLTAPDGAAGDYFGISVALSGDTAVVGAWLDNNVGGADAGSAYVFVRSGATWTMQTKLTASDAADYDEFGLSVAVSGDTVLVGAYRDDHAGGTDAGSAYVFVRTGTVWTEQAKLTASDAAATDSFGVSVALSGDTVVVGSSHDDHATAVDAGSTYVFTRSGTAWTQQARLVASDATVGALFGQSVSVSGDTVLVGASFAFVSGSYPGAAYVFLRTGLVWNQQAKLTTSDAAPNDLFGYSVAVLGNTALVGALLDDHAGGTDSGSAHLFVRTGTVWIRQSKLIASDTAADDQFGISVALSGDTAVVGSVTDDHAGGADAGSAYFFFAGLDSDCDGVPNANDNCPNAPNPSQADGDGDGTADACDGCPNDANKIAPGACGCGTADTDTDGDGTPNCNDGCPNDALKIVAGACGCGNLETDTDTDGRPDCVDNCPTVPNADQADANNNGVGDACETTNPPGGQTNPACGQPGAACGMGTAGLMPMGFLMIRLMRPTRRRRRHLTDRY